MFEHKRKKKAVAHLGLQEMKILIISQKWNRFFQLCLSYQEFVWGFYNRERMSKMKFYD